MIYDAYHHFSQEKINEYPQTDFKGYIGQIVCNDFKLTIKIMERIYKKQV